MRFLAAAPRRAAAAALFSATFLAAPLSCQNETGSDTWARWLADSGVNLSDLGQTEDGLSQAIKRGVGASAVVEMNGVPTVVVLWREPVSTTDERQLRMRELVARQRAQGELLKRCLWLKFADWQFPELVEGRLAIEGRIAESQDRIARREGIVSCLMLADVASVELSDDSVAGTQAAYTDCLLGLVRDETQVLAKREAWMAECHRVHCTSQGFHPLDGLLQFARRDVEVASQTLQSCLGDRYKTEIDDDWLVDLAELSFQLGEGELADDIMRQLARRNYQVVGR